MPTLSDIYRLAEQLELDKSASVKALRARDHQIGLACDATDDSAMLLFWLRQVSGQRSAGELHKGSRLTESGAALIARMLALFFGFTAMASLLLSSGQGLVNVFVFVFIFVFLQFAMSVFAAWAMCKTIAGNSPVVLPVNPAKLLLSRIYPDPRYLRELQAVLRLAFLRYGQEMGALFTAGAMGGFLVVLALSEFTFVWGSTFGLSDTLVVTITDVLSWPWSSLLPAATVDAQVIADSRFHPALTELGRVDIERMRGWWPFLFMSLVCYALLPRVLLWTASRFYSAKTIRAAFITYPCSDLVLSRMRSPMVETQGADGGAAAPSAAVRGAGKLSYTQPDGGLLLLNWAGALGAGEAHDFEEFAAVPPDHVVGLGSGSLAGDIEAAQQAAQGSIDRLLVVVKSWEPPLAELADVLAYFSQVSRCTVYPLALEGRPVTAGKMEDWRSFSRALPFAVVDVRALEAV